MGPGGVSYFKVVWYTDGYKIDLDTYTDTYKSSCNITEKKKKKKKK